MPALQTLSNHLKMLVLALSYACSATADPAPISSEDYTALIAGNSIEGVWAGRDYRQFFGRSGSTTYQEKGSAETFGSWRINDQGQMCTRWPPSDQEVCYVSHHKEDLILWNSGDDWFPSRVHPGKRLY